MWEIVLAILFLTLSLVFSFLVAVPLAGTLVRFRVNYTPKGLQLDGEGGVQPHTGPVVKSFFAMFRRVKRLEGWAGLYKGFMPTILSTFVIMAFVALLPGTSLTNPGGHKKYSAPVDGIWNRLAYSFFMMVIALPVVIISNRAITTPYKLPWFNALYSLRVLLTPTERRRPWTLYVTPGLLISEVLSTIYIVLILDPVRSWIFPSLANQTVGVTSIAEDFSAARLSLYMGLVFISTLILCPLEVVSARLSIQRNHAASGFTAVANDDDVDLHGSPVYSAAEEDVIGLRNEDDPYTGFVDCVKRIASEEGVGTLYRAWWLVFLPLLAVAFIA